MKTRKEKRGLKKLKENIYKKFKKRKLREKSLTKSEEVKEKMFKKFEL